MNKQVIYLNDLLRMSDSDLANTKIRFNIPDGNNKDWDPIEKFKNGKMQELLAGHYWNKDYKSYKDGQITIGLARLKKDSTLWLLFHVGKVTKDLNVKNGTGYEFESLPEYEKFYGRLIVKFKNKGQNLIREAKSVINVCEVHEILSDIFDDDIFPGYENVNISWKDLERVIQKPTWQTALKNQKGVYLITDVKTGKRYVGSAYGKDMLLGRWQAYVKTGDGCNVQLKALGFDYIKENFRYSILEIFKSTIDDTIIIERESWWKENLLTRTDEYGYNAN